MEQASERLIDSGYNLGSRQRRYKLVKLILLARQARALILESENRLYNFQSLDFYWLPISKSLDKSLSLIFKAGARLRLVPLQTWARGPGFEPTNLKFCSMLENFQFGPVLSQNMTTKGWKVLKKSEYYNWKMRIWTHDLSIAREPLDPLEHHQSI